MNISLLRRASAERGFGLITLAAFLWGTVGVTTQTIYGLAATNPLSVGFFRLGIAAPLVALACWRVLGRRALAVTRGDMALMLVMGAVMGLYQVCYFAAIGHAGVAVATLVTLCTAPVMVALMSALFMRERLAPRTLLALAAALAGTALLVGGPGDSASGSGSTVTGVVFALGSAFGYALITILGRRLADRVHPLQTTAVGFASGALLLLGLSLGGRLALSYPAAGWALLAYLGCAPTALAYLLFLFGMRSISATVASIVTLLEPLVATVLAWLFLGERLGPLGLGGAACLLGAMVMLYFQSARPE